MGELELVLMGMGVLVELDLVLEELDLVLGELNLVLELESGELLLEPDLLWAVALVVELVLVSVVLVLVMDLLVTLVAWWLSPMEQLYQLRSQQLLLCEQNILLLLLPARVNL